jgi:hypothetical protein
MQNAKDTFFRMLAARLAALNPARTLVVRGLTRPGVLVEENELPSNAVTTDAFCLSWTSLRQDTAQALPMLAIDCSIRYATDGSAGAAGTDRGRALAAMDAELSAALLASPSNSPKLNFATASAGTGPITMATDIAWSDPVFGPAEAAGERLARTVTVQVLAWQEAGEL